MVGGLSGFAAFRWKVTSLAAIWYLLFAETQPALAQRCQQNTRTIDFSVHVTDSDREEPIDQVRVDLVRPPAELVDAQFTDSKGETGFSCVLPMAYILRTSKDGYVGSEVQVDFRRNENNAQVPLQLRRATAERQRADAKVVSARTLAIPERAREEFQAGIEFLNQRKDPKGAVEHLQKAIAAYPEYYEAYFLMGMAEVQLKQPDDARAALAQAIKLNPKFLEPYYPLATLLIGEKQYGEGERVLHQAQELDPNGWQWLFELARCLAYQQKWGQAVSYGQAALKIPNAPAKVHVLMADLYEDTGRANKAIEELEEFEKLDPNSPLIPRVRAQPTQGQ
jgi:Flp pilus assembly protein TadD